MNSRHDSTGKAEGAFLFLLIIHWRSNGSPTAHRGPSGRWCALPNLFALFFTHEVAGKIIFRHKAAVETMTARVASNSFILNSPFQSMRSDRTLTLTH